MDISTRDKILEVAERLFADMGYDGASIRDIAKKANINISMISYYFQSKRGLFEELLKSKTLLRKEIVNEVSSSNAELSSKIKRVIECYVDGFFKHRYMCTIIARELSESNMNPETIKLLFNDLALFRTVINKGISDGIIVDVDVELLITSFISTIFQVVKTPYFYIDSMGIEEADQLFEEPYQTIMKQRLKKFLFNLSKGYIIKEK